MPVVSVNLSDAAYYAYRTHMKHGRRGSAYVSSAIELKAYSGLKAEYRSHTLLPGDMRRTSNGYLLQYALQNNGSFSFNVIEVPEGQEKLDLSPPIGGEKE
jgi:hypothetical protein